MDSDVTFTINLKDDLVNYVQNQFLFLEDMSKLKEEFHKSKSLVLIVLEKDAELAIFMVFQI